MKGLFRKTRRAFQHFPFTPYQLPRLAKRSRVHSLLTLLLLLPFFRLLRAPQKSVHTRIHLPPQPALVDRRQFNLSHLPPVVAPTALPRVVYHEAPPFPTRSTTFSSERIVNATFEAVLICHFSNPCCYGSVSPTLQSLIKQTVVPSSLILLHSCNLPPQQRILRGRAESTIRSHGSKAVSLALYKRTFDFYCSSRTESQYDECLLHYLARNSPGKRFRFLISDREILEPLALEKFWMYLEFHPNVTAVKSLSFREDSLKEAFEKTDPMLVKPNLPDWNHTSVKDIDIIPMMYRDDAFVNTDRTAREDDDQIVWESLVRLLTNARLFREALYTTIHPGQKIRDLSYNHSVLSLQHARIGRHDIPPHLHSDLAFYKWSGRKEEREMYIESFQRLRHVDLESLAIGQVENIADKRVMFLMPCMDMGGSEKAMLDLAARMLSLRWTVTFVFTMPNWEEDSLGELSASNAWLHKALGLTSDVINLVALAPNHLTTKAFRYIIESRRPDIVINSNTRWAYGHSELIRAIAPEAVVVDYNHMIHESWNGGGLPRYGANNSRYFDVHFTASEDVAAAMKEWISPAEMDRNPHKIKTCHIGTDPALFHAGLDRRTVGASYRYQLNIPSDITVILFAGRFVAAKGTDVMIDVINRSSFDNNLRGRLFFVFVGEGHDRHRLEHLKQKRKNVLVLPPAPGLLEMRNYYAMSDILLLPSINEGIALVLYEAMASELLVMTTDVGGQHELVTPESGILIPAYSMQSKASDAILESLQDVLRNPKQYEKMRGVGRVKVESEFTTSKFCDCVIDGLRSVERGYRRKHKSGDDITFRKLETRLVHEARTERMDGLWKRGMAPRSLRYAITIGIKTYVCDSQTVQQVHSLLRSIRVNYPEIRVLFGNDGPISLAEEAFFRADPHTEEVMLPRNSGISIGRNTLVNMTITQYFLLLDDDHIMDDSTNLVNVVTALERGKYDIVGLRIRNLPGIEELERLGISIPRYVANIKSLKKRRLVLCIWNENEGPSVQNMKNAIKVDVLHNAFLARTDALRKQGWRDELEVNEHMSFFLDSWKAGARVGYLPSEFVHHRARLYSKCYHKIRFREDRFRKLLDYEDRFFYDLKCGNEFPKIVLRHLNGGLFLNFDDEDDDLADGE